MKKIIAKGVNNGASFTIGDNTLARGAGPWITSIGNGVLDARFEELRDLSSGVPLPIVHGGETTEIHPVVDYGFSSEALRDAYLLGLQNSVPLLAHVTITTGSTSVYINYAEMRPITWKLIGETAVEITYTIRGQKISSTTVKS